MTTSDETRYTVTGPKLHLFLLRRVIGRTVTRKGLKKTISKSLINGYISAVTHLWSTQKKKGINSHDAPRPFVKDLLDQFTANQHKQFTKNFEDRGSGTLLDGYTSKETLKNILNYFWGRERSEGLRDHLGFIFCHGALLRGQAVRQMDLSDLHHLELNNESQYAKAHALILTQRNGKTNRTYF